MCSVQNLISRVNDTSIPPRDPGRVHSSILIRTIQPRKHLQMPHRSTTWPLIISRIVDLNGCFRRATCNERLTMMGARIRDWIRYPSNQGSRARNGDRPQSPSEVVAQTIKRQWNVWILIIANLYDLSVIVMFIVHISSHFQLRSCACWSQAGKWVARRFTVHGTDGKHAPENHLKTESCIACWWLPPFTALSALKTLLCADGSSWLRCR